MRKMRKEYLAVKRASSPFDEISEHRAPAYNYEIFMAGDERDAKRYLAQRTARTPGCWSVMPAEYVYTGGREAGFVVRAINYPRFPKPVDEIERDVILLAKELMEELGQGSCSITGLAETIWLTRRREDKGN